LRKTYVAEFKTMRQVTVIGTLHTIIPGAEAQLEGIFNRSNPDQILVEIVQADLDFGTVDSYPKEMVFAANWAGDRGIAVAGFDSLINIFRSDAAPDGNQRLLEYQLPIIASRPWWHFNKVEFNQELLGPDWYDVIDRTKERARQAELLNNSIAQMREGYYC
jgi:hypothetical protein